MRTKYKALVISFIGFMILQFGFSNCSKVSFKEDQTAVNGKISNDIQVDDQMGESFTAKVDESVSPGSGEQSGNAEVDLSCVDSYSTGSSAAIAGKGKANVAGGCVPQEFQSCEGQGELASGMVACWGWHDQGADGNVKDFDPRMCRVLGNVTSVRDANFDNKCGNFSFGCEIAASKCASGKAIAVSYEAIEDTCMKEKWVYECL